MKSLTIKFKLVYATIFIFIMSSLGINATAQDKSITTYQYRHVPDDKVAEFVKRETTYWSKVADKAIKDKKMNFWALLEKVGGYDLPNSSNFLFVNTFPDIDQIGDVFNNVEDVAGVKWSEMETSSMSTTTSQFFLNNRDWAQAANAKPGEDFNYIVMNYHNTDYADSLIRLEKKYWMPFIQSAMDKGQTKQLAWGNAVVLAPRGDNIKFTTVSYDLFKNLRDALMPDWDAKTVFPTKGLTMINKISLNRPGIAVYRIVKVVSDN
ncbi:MAG: hypothetical protein GC171_07295 [Terrimonas sp.]|nr:hypothetical protein [Terrimonas sp.]